MTETIFGGPNEHLTLGRLIAILRDLPAKSVVGFDVASDLIPTRFDSYRGDYSEVALGYNMGMESPSKEVGVLLVQARHVVGHVLHGYKGGSYTMNEATGLWMANHGNLGRRITHVEVVDHWVTLMTAGRR